MVYELTQRGIHFQRQAPLPVVYKDVLIDCGYRLDLLVEHQIIVELKAIDRLGPIHDAQLLSYLTLSGCSNKGSAGWSSVSTNNPPLRSPRPLRSIFPRLFRTLGTEPSAKLIPVPYLGA